MKNEIIAGDYLKGTALDYSMKKHCLYFTYRKGGFFSGEEKVFIDKSTVRGYDVMSEDSKKSMSSGIMRGAIGGAVFGGVGALAGAMSGKNKGVHTVAIEFNDGKRILCQLDDSWYKTLVTSLF